MVDLGAERMAAEWMQNFFRNSAEPGGVIEFPSTLQDADFQRLADRWRMQHQGVANAHRVAIIERGTWKDRKLTQRDMQFEQLRRFERDQILGAFGMPLPIMGITESVNRANAEAAEVMYARWLVKPRLMRIRAALNEKLLKLYPDGESLMFDFVDPVPENRVELINEGVLGFEKQVLTLNEARRRFGEDDWEGPEGDERNKPASMPMMLPPRPDTTDEVEDDEETDDDEMEAGYKPGRRPRRRRQVDPNDEYPDEANIAANRIEQGWRRRFGIELQSLILFLEQAEKGYVLGDTVEKLTPKDADAYDWDWWAKYSDEVIAELTSTFALVLAAEAPALSLPLLQRLASLYAEQRANDLLRVGGQLSMPDNTRSRVNQLVSETIAQGDSLNTLTRRLRDDVSFSAQRARTVARTETAQALGQGQKQAAKSKGLSEKRWVTQGDSLVNPEICRANSEQRWIPINDKFQSDHDTIPGHINCRCVVLYRNRPLEEQWEDDLSPGTGRSFVPEVRCPQCNRKHGENVATGTQIKCRRCKHQWEV